MTRDVMKFIPITLLRRISHRGTVWDSPPNPKETLIQAVRSFRSKAKKHPQESCKGIFPQNGIPKMINKCV
eukprot:3357842-Amphidinium_carterae.1